MTADQALEHAATLEGMDRATCFPESQAQALRAGAQALRAALQMREELLRVLRVPIDPPCSNCVAVRALGVNSG